MEPAPVAQQAIWLLQTAGAGEPEGGREREADGGADAVLLGVAPRLSGGVGVGVKEGVEEGEGQGGS